MEDAYACTVDQVAAKLGVDVNQGLTDGQVSRARSRYGRNELEPEEGTPLWKLVLKQFDDLLVKILIAAAVVDLIIALVSGETGVSAFVEPGVIVLILLANAVVGVITETKAEKAIEALKAYEAESATVVRHGHLTLLPSAELVPGDVVEVCVGGKIPADLRISRVMTNALRVDQAILTGESGSVSKDASPVSLRKAVYQDMHNILFSGTVVTAGRARGVVVATGPNTAIGKIRDAMVEVEEEMTPLRKQLDEFGTFLSKVIAAICIVVWIINIPHFTDPLHGGWVMGAVYYFKIAVALAVAAIPEGLPAVVTTCLALGTRKMAAHNAIVRRLPSVETLGCTTVICTDKTGTLTTNQMSVAKVAFLNDRSAALAEYDVTGTSYNPKGQLLGPGGEALADAYEQPCLEAIAQACALCNDSTLYYDPVEDDYTAVGEATEVALRVLVEKIGFPGRSSHPSGLTAAGMSPKAWAASRANDHWSAALQRAAVLEFSRDRKMMSTLNAAHGRVAMFVKGAPEAVLARCKDALVNSGAAKVELTSERRNAVLGAVQRMGASKALRCLALAVKEVAPDKTALVPADEGALTFVGVVGMHDPPRPEVRGAIAACHSAGIRVIVVTGDNVATAAAVCTGVGVSVRPADGGGLALTGVDFDELSATEQSAAVEELALFSRVEPSHKSKLVELLKAEGHVVAMTGDGVNDAPALKRADIGVAMGSGTAVAKHAADMVLADDNFATIVQAVEQGRCIYANTKQFIRYMVSSNIGEVVAILSAALIGMPETLNPVQLLWVNLVTDGLPATALGFNKADPNIMKTKPRSQNEGIVDRWLFIRYLVIGIYVGVVTVGGFMWWYMAFEGGPQLSWSELRHFDSCVEGAARYSCEVFQDRTPSTVSMTVLVVVEMFNALNALSENASLLQVPFWSNGWLLIAIAMSMLVHFAILYTPPLAMLFSVTALDWEEWAMIVVLCFPVIILDEALKYISRNFVHGNRKLPRVLSRLSNRFPILKSKRSDISPYLKLPTEEI